MIVTPVAIINNPATVSPVSVTGALPITVTG
jgi:hypothetical protein